MTAVQGAESGAIPDIHTSDGQYISLTDEPTYLPHLSSSIYIYTYSSLYTLLFQILVALGDAELPPLLCSASLRELFV